MDRALFFRTSHLTNLRSHSETSDLKARATNVRDNAILPPTASGDGAGARFVSTDCVTSPTMAVVRASVRHCRLRLTFRLHKLNSSFFVGFEGHQERGTRSHLVEGHQEVTVEPVRN
jgi:hypothetical protein